MNLKTQSAKLPEVTTVFQKPLLLQATLPLRSPLHNNLATSITNVK